jgi:hypothetical protein
VSLPSLMRPVIGWRIVGGVGGLEALFSDWGIEVLGVLAAGWDLPTLLARRGVVLLALLLGQRLRLRALDEAGVSLMLGGRIGLCACAPA